MFETALPPQPRFALYAATALVAGFELLVAWQAIHPNVSATYRGYYIDRTTTCLDQAVSGDYQFGSEISFRSGSENLVKPLKVCGWEGPVGDGLHAVGESSRLRFALPNNAHGLSLLLELVAVDFAANGRQRVDVGVDGQIIGTLDVLTGAPQRFKLAIPDGALDRSGKLELELHFPEAQLVAPQDSNTRKRSIKLTAARVWSGTAGDDPWTGLTSG